MFDVPVGGASQAENGFLETGLYRLPEGILLRGVADSAPAPDAKPAAPNLEDAYVWLMAREDHDGAAAA